MRIKKEKRKEPFEKILTLGRGEIIAYKGQFTKQRLILLEGSACIESENGSKNLVHVYGQGELLNKVELELSCPMLKTIKCLTKCKISLGTSACAKETECSDTQELSAKLKNFLLTYTYDKEYREEIVRYCEYREFSRFTRIEIMEDRVYLLMSGVLNIMTSNKTMCKNIETAEIYPVMYTGTHQMHFEFLTNSKLFIAKYSIFQHFLDEQELISLTETFTRSSQFFLKQIGDKKGLRSFSLKNEENKNYINKENRKKSFHFKTKLDAEKIINNNCMAQRYFRFSIKTKFKNNVKEMGHNLREVKSISQWAKISRKMDLSLCCYHTNSCPNKYKSQANLSLSESACMNI